MTGRCVYEWANGRGGDVVWVMGFEMMMIGGAGDWHCLMSVTDVSRDEIVSERAMSWMHGWVCYCDGRIGETRCVGLESGSVSSRAIWIWERMTFSRIGSVNVSVGDGALSCLAGV